MIENASESTVPTTSRIIIAPKNPCVSIKSARAGCSSRRTAHDAAERCGIRNARSTRSSGRSSTPYVESNSASIVKAQEVFEAAGVADRVVAVNADVRELPFSHEEVRRDHQHRRVRILPDPRGLGSRRVDLEVCILNTSVEGAGRARSRCNVRPSALLIFAPALQTSWT